MIRLQSYHQTNVKPVDKGETSPLQKTFHLSAPKIKKKKKQRNDWMMYRGQLHAAFMTHLMVRFWNHAVAWLSLKTLISLTFRTDTRHTQGSNMPVPALALILQMNENLFFQWTQWRWTGSLQKETNRPLFKWVQISKCFTKFKKEINELW